MNSAPMKPTLSVEEIMTTEVIRILPELKLWEVIEKMIQHQISGAPVVDKLDRVLSMVGEGDVLRLAASEGLDATIAHCLPKLKSPKGVISLPRTALFTEAYRLFLKHSIHRIPIVDGSGALKGLVTRSLVLRLFIEAHYGKKITLRSGR